MSLTSIQLYATSTQAILTQIASFSLDLASYTDRYIIRNITGLDVEEITPKVYGSGQNGSKYYNMRPAPREIAMRIILNPQYAAGQTPDTLRKELYKIISSYRTGELELHFLDGVSQIGILKGLITKFEAGLFNQIPEVQITIRCEYPFFRKSTRTSVTGLTPTNTSITTNSTAPHGFRCQVTFTAFQVFFQIAKPGDNDWRFRVNRTFGPGDQLFISSEDDNKYVYAIIAGSTIQLANAVFPGSFWPLLFPGFNQFEVVGPNFTYNSFDYYETHWGM